MEKAITFFTEIQKMIFSEKNSYLNLIDQNTQKMIQEQDVSHQLVNRYSNEIQKFISDIDLNFDNIVHDMEMDPFRDIMSAYESRIASIEQQIDEIPRKFKNSELLIENDQVYQKIRELIQNGLQYQEIGNYNQFGVVQSVDRINIPSIGNSPQFNQLTTQTQKSQESDQMRQTINIKQSNDTDLIRMFKTSNESDYCKFQKYIKQNEEIIIDQIKENSQDSQQKSQINESNSLVGRVNSQITQRNQDSMQDNQFGSIVKSDSSNRYINNSSVTSKMQTTYEKCLNIQNRVSSQGDQVDNPQFKNKLQQQLQKHRDQTKKGQFKIQVNYQKPNTNMNSNVGNNNSSVNNSNVAGGIFSPAFMNNIQMQNFSYNKAKQFQTLSDKK